MGLEPARAQNAGELRRRTALIGKLSSEHIAHNRSDQWQLSQAHLFSRGREKRAGNPRPANGHGRSIRPKCLICRRPDTVSSPDIPLHEIRIPSGTSKLSKTGFVIARDAGVTEVLPLGAFPLRNQVRSGAARLFAPRTGCQRAPQVPRTKHLYLDAFMPADDSRAVEQFSVYVEIRPIRACRACDLNKPARGSQL
jgi:hypothetical protein